MKTIYLFCVIVIILALTAEMGVCRRRNRNRNRRRTVSKPVGSGSYSREHNTIKTKFEVEIATLTKQKKVDISGLHHNCTRIRNILRKNFNKKEQELNQWMADDQSSTMKYKDKLKSYEKRKAENYERYLIDDGFVQSTCNSMMEIVKRGFKQGQNRWLCWFSEEKKRLKNKYSKSD